MTVIFVIEEDKSMAKMVADVVNKIGDEEDFLADVEVKIFHKASEAVALIDLKKPILILTGFYFSPEDNMNGLDVFIEAKKKDVRVILMTGNPSFTLDQAMKRGIFGQVVENFITKPFSNNDFVNEILKKIK